MLETLEQQNLKEFSLLAEEKTGPFDPASYWDAVDWDQLRNHIDSERATAINYFVDYFAKAKILNPYFHFDYSKKTIDGLIDRTFQKRIDFENIYYIAPTLASTKTINSALLPKEQIESKIKTPLSEAIVYHRNSIEKRLELASVFRILFPEDEVVLREGDWELGLSKFKNYFDVTRQDRFSNDILVGAYMRIIKPNFIPPLETEDWDLLKEQVREDKMRYADWYHPLNLSYAVKILAAEKVVTDESGLTLVMQEEKKEPMPERRKF